MSVQLSRNISWMRYIYERCRSRPLSAHASVRWFQANCFPFRNLLPPNRIEFQFQTRTHTRARAQCLLWSLGVRKHAKCRSVSIVSTRSRKRFRIYFVQCSHMSQLSIHKPKSAASHPAQAGLNHAADFQHTNVCDERESVGCPEIQNSCSYWECALHSLLKQSVRIRPEAILSFSSSTNENGYKFISCATANDWLWLKSARKNIVLNLFVCMR